MNMKERSGGEMGFSDVGGKEVVVAVKVSKEMPKTALLWTLTHVAQPGDRIKLLVVIPAHSSSKMIWGFSRFTSDCTTGHRRSLSGTRSDQKDDVAELCAQMMLKLHNVYDSKKIKIRLKIVSGSRCGVVAAEANKAQSSWVILDKRLKQEKKNCMEELQCNIVIMKRAQPKVLRLNLLGSPKLEPELLSFDLVASPNRLKNKHYQVNMIRGPVVTPASSPFQESPFTATDVGTSSISSSDIGTSPFYISGICGKHEEKLSLDGSDSDTDSEMLGPPIRSGFQPWVGGDLGPGVGFSTYMVDGSQRYYDQVFTSTYEGMLKKLSKLDRDPDIGALNYRLDVDLSKSVREAVALSKNAPPGAPPLCSICQHKAPIFGNPPRWFSYAELDLATDGFSKKNFLAEGGYGSVHRGQLQDGRVVAVKQHKLASSQGDVEFCSEVEVLSCAQHRNVVMLIGFCVEDGRRLLVYEYICNGSLDSHLYGRHQEPLEWSARQKIAVGAARGLRYLHEECRVGCIVHRDLRPNNILLTHDFEPLVGDFGLARWQPDGDMGVETRVIGTFGYLAPEYAQSGQITEKADVYSFGVVLVELVTGRKAMDLKRPKGQQCLTEWARPLLEKHAINELIDPLLRNCYSEPEIHSMLQCAFLCIRRDPHSRPRMSQVLRILEGDIVM